MAGVVVALNMVAYGQLIFPAHPAEGVGYVLLSAIAIRTLLALRSSFPVLLSSPQALNATVSAVLAARLAPLGLPTVLAGLALTALLTGVVTLLLAGLGARLTRWVKPSVVGGFMVGSGFLLVTGAARLLPGDPTWALVLAALLLAAGGRRPLALPMLTLGSVVLFYLVPMDRTGWLLGPFPAASGLPGVHWTQVQWTSLAVAWKEILTVPLLAVLQIVLATPAIGTFIERPGNLGQELRAAGLTNLLVGFCGGMAGFHAPVETMLVWRLGGRTRLAPLVSVAVMLAVLVGGPRLLELVPHFAVAGFLLYLGAWFLLDWAVLGAFRLPRREYSVVMATGLVIALWGFLPGIALGLAAGNLLPKGDG